MIGTIINSILIVAGSLIGMFVGKGIPERIKNTLMQGLSLCVMLIGLKGALGIDSTTITKIDMMCIIICTVIGGLIGSAINIEQKLDLLGSYFEKKIAKSASKQNSFSKAFVTATLVYCVGAMAIVGAINSGISGDHSTLIAKGIIDGVTAIVFTSTLGIGVILSAAAVFIYQGIIAILAAWLSPFLTAELIAHMSAVGGLLIIGVGLNMLRDQHLPVGNLLPAIFMPILYFPIVPLF